MKLELLTIFLTAVAALDCGDKNLAPYKLNELFTSITSNTVISDTPPSKTNQTWYLNLCNQEKIIHEDCPVNSQICGVQTVLLPGEAPIKTQVVSFSNRLNYDVSVNDTEVFVSLEGASWGSNSIGSDIKLYCSDKEDINISWDLERLDIEWWTPAACLKSDKGHKTPTQPPKKDKDSDGDKDKKKDDSWGWFTWLFILFVLAFGSYIIIGAWITVSNRPADLQDAVHDFKDTLVNLARAGPGFISEIFAKIFGENNRGGYSAV